MSKTRKRYMARLIGRIIVFVICAVLCFVRPQSFDILNGKNFFSGFSAFHLLWVIWVGDMLLQIIPIKNKFALGSQKLFANRFRPIVEKINYKALKNYVVTTTKAAYKVFLIWTALIACLGVLYYNGIMGKIGLFMTSVLFYVCDL
ncbi:MAG: hypothetical protein IJN63_10575, partial [Clostridia bacterium]|nr:hypothetical protein [Clostridia bacterium]